MTRNSTTYHVAQSIEGALMNWTKRDWALLAKTNNLTIEQVKRWMLDQHAAGKKRLPIGERCEGFDDVTGCPGHRVEQEAVTR